MLSKGGEKIEYEASVTFKISPSENVKMKFRKDDTDGKFVTQSEYVRLIRIKKLNKIYK